jgi:hypothetical protein
MHTIYIKSLILHVSAISRHPQGYIIQRHIKPTHPSDIYSAKNKTLKINNGSRTGKNVDIIDNVMLTYS